MRILFINNLGAGFADYVSIEEGTTIEKFFKNKMQGEQTADYLIRVNRQPVPTVAGRRLVGHAQFTKRGNLFIPPLVKGQGGFLVLGALMPLLAFLHPEVS